MIQKRGGRANQAPAKPKKAPIAQQEPEETELPTSSSSSSSENEGNEVTGKAAGPSKSRAAATSAPATDNKNASITQIAQKAVSSSPIVNPTQSTTQVEAELMEIEAIEAEEVETESRNENPNAEGPKETVMEQTIRMTRGRLRKTRSEESR